MIKPSYAKAERTLMDVADLLLPPSRIPLSESVKEVLFVKNGGGNMVPYDSTLTPYMNEVMDCAIGPQSRKYSAVCFVGPARTGKTAANVMGPLAHIISRAPGDTLVVHMTQPKSIEWRKTELERLLRASPLVKAQLSPRPRDNNVGEIILRNGTLIKIAYPAPSQLAGSTYKNVLITDLDRMPLDNGEGDIFGQASKRTQTYGTSGLVMVESSPGYDITDPTFVPATPHEAPPVAGGIMSIHNQGDRRLFYWQCPDCGEWFEADFDSLLWDTNEKDPVKAAADVVLPCPHCGVAYRERQLIKGVPFKQYANNRGLWVPEGCQLDQNGTLHGERRPSEIASFWMKGPQAAFASWNQLVAKYAAGLKTYQETGDHTPLKVTINVDQGKPFKMPRSGERDPNALAARRKDLGSRVVPPWVRALIATVDVQNGAKTGRFEVQVHGVGKGLRSVIVDRFKIEKSRRENPDKPGAFVRVNPGVHAEDWDLLIEKVMLKSYPIDDDSGRHMRVYRTACDSAGTDATTDNAYQFWRRLKKLGLHRSFLLVKGSSRAGAPLIEKRFPDNTSRKDRKVVVSGDVPVYFLNSNRVKDLASACLGREDGGPRSLAFPEWLPESFFAELVAEERDPAGKWAKVSASARNEGFDLLAYFWAVLADLKAFKIVDWDGHLPAWLADADTNAEVFTPIEEDEENRLPVPRRRRRRSSM